LWLTIVLDEGRTTKDESLSSARNLRLSSFVFRPYSMVVNYDPVRPFAGASPNQP
jgi:hypothetical protein